MSKPAPKLRKPEPSALSHSEGLGAWLRTLRQSRELPLRVVAAGTEMDSTLLSKIELGQRLPTGPQAGALARFFAVPFDEMQARRIAEKFWQEHKDDPGAERAISLLRATANNQAQTRHG